MTIIERHLLKFKKVLIEKVYIPLWHHCQPLLQSLFRSSDLGQLFTAEDLKACVCVCV